MNSAEDGDEITFIKACIYKIMMLYLLFLNAYGLLSAALQHCSITTTGTTRGDDGMNIGIRSFKQAAPSVPEEERF